MPLVVVLSNIVLDGGLGPPREGEIGGRNLQFAATPHVAKLLLFNGRTRTAYLYRCVWSGITGR